MKYNCLVVAFIMVGCAVTPEEPGTPVVEEGPVALTANASTPEETQENAVGDNVEALECGAASYYADSLAGRPTASGEPYEPRQLTAAHKTLPIGTILDVQRTDNRASVTVTINDRGPFSPGRIIDLSRAAAEQIDLVTDGVTEVCIYDAS